MGTSKSFGELAKKLEASAKAIETKSDTDIVLADAKRATLLIRGQIKRAVPRGTLNVGKSGRKKVGARYDLIRNGGGAIVKATGPLHLVERDTSPHNIPRVKGDVRSYARSGKKLKRATTVRSGPKLKRLLIGGEVRMGPVKHPGTKGKHPFEKGVKQFLPSAGKSFEKNLDKLMGEIF